MQRLSTVWFICVSFSFTYASKSTKGRDGVEANHLCQVVWDIDIGDTSLISTFRKSGESTAVIVHWLEVNVFVPQV